MDGERPLELTDEEIVALPVDELGLRVLRHVADDQEWNSYNWMDTWRNLGYRQGTPVLRALAEAWELVVLQRIGRPNP